MDFLTPTMTAELLGVDDTIYGGAALPVFTLPVKDLFDAIPGDAS